MLKRLLRALLPGPVRRRLQRWRLDRSLRQFPRRLVTHTYAGVRLTVELADDLAVGWYDHDWGTLPELDVLAGGRLRPGAAVFDCGAHQGVVGLILADRVGATGRVVLVEPNPHNAEQCRRNAGRNNRPWVTVEQAAVADRPGELLFNAGLNGAAAAVSDYAGVTRVPAVTIDELAARHGPPDVVFLDVEGFECQALAGATDTLVGRPDWAVEVHVGCGLEAAGGSVESVLAHFPAAAYRRFVHAEGDTTAVPIEAAPAGLFRSRFFLTALARPADA